MGGNKKKPSQSNATKSQENRGGKKEEVKKTPASKTQQKQKLSVLIEEISGIKDTRLDESYHSSFVRKGIRCENFGC